MQTASMSSGDSSFYWILPNLLLIRILLIERTCHSMLFVCFICSIEIITE
nr:MAG TPA: hypothetical protein [Caudoviricetes sp.]